jgi:hypothetical protein
MVFPFNRSHPQFLYALTPPPPFLSDLVPGVYEGGFKLWEGRSLAPSLFSLVALQQVISLIRICSVDLVAFLHKSSDHVSLTLLFGCKILTSMPREVVTR